MIEMETKYWETQWADRIDGRQVKGNKEKIHKILDFLWSSSKYFTLDKLDVGCGPSHHAITLSLLLKGFQETWTGIDLSQVAVDFARSNGMNAICGNFFEYDFINKFDVFFFWDSLEHFENLDLVANKINRLKKDKIHICGNVPLFISDIHAQGGVENPMNINILWNFLSKCGCTELWYEVYGTHGWPFLLFDAEGKK